MPDTYIVKQLGIGSIVSGGTTGSVIFIDGNSSLAQDNANFFWDDTNTSLLLQGGSNFTPTVAANVPINAAGDANTFVEILHQNENAGTAASGDYIVTADTGTDSSNYMDLGINSSGNTAATWGGALDGYLFASDGQLSIGTNSNKSFYILTGTGAGANSARRFQIDGTGVINTGTTLGMFSINATGNITKINNVTTNFPSSQGSAGTQFMNDGSGNLSWVDLATGQFSPADPTTTTSTTGVMMGLGLTATITTVATTNVSVIISGDVDNNTAADGSQFQIRFGTGTAPSNGAVLSGTTAGGLVKMVNANATSLLGTTFTPGRSPFSLNAIITVSLATATWVDVSLASITGGTSRIRDLSMTLQEI